MGLSANFVIHPWFKPLKSRASSFYEMMKHLEASEGGWIVETGCAWDRENWAGQGQSTRIWDWVASQRDDFKVLSIDLSPEHVDIAKSQVSKVDFICSDSLVALNSLPASTVSIVRLLYLDSFDWCIELNLESAFHHFAELACVWRNLPSGCLVVVDDRHDAGAGKHWLVEAFFSKMGVSPLFCDYQIGWVKP